MRSRTLYQVLAMALLALGASACNLDFDASQYQAIEVEADAQDEDAADLDQEDLGQGDLGDDLGDEVNNDQNNEEQVCVDNDQDTFGVGLACPKDQIDCDDRRQVVYPGAPEVCDSLDNDCDGHFDEDADNQPLTQECYTGQESDLEHPNTACQAGRVACAQGQYPNPVTPELCVGQVLPSNLGELEEPARCDGIDNDCDGVIDPACPCESAGQTRRCYNAGPPNKRGVGICVEGVQTCFEVEGEGRQWGECEDDVGPAEETCANMGSDDDCDGEEDNIPLLGESCETGEPGRCRIGTWRCEDAELICVRNLNPTSELCDEIDSDCDGDINNGVDNACGGCGELEGTPQESCGVCGDGTWTCTDMGEISCVGARTLNVCGGCSLLTSPLGGECGVCGTYVCDGAESIVCDDPGLNTCGGCGDINGGDLLDTRCGICGTYVCDGTDGVRCEDAPTNACNGCAELEGAPGQSCGVCGDGNYACEGNNAVRCVGASPLNACGGCQDLQGVSPGDNCGVCGRQRCDQNNLGRLTCEDPGTNACGGCSALDNEPGQACGVCGQYACGQGNNSTFCEDPGLNACGGCGELAGAPGASCGVCGQYACDGTSAVVCDDPGTNACGSCTELAGQPGDSCGACGAWVCSLNGMQVNCQDPGTNACGGCGAVAGVELLGQSCGTCGTYVCDETGNGVRCDDPGLNTCLGCGTLENAPGSRCEDACGVYLCDEDDAGTTCDERRCPSAPTTARLINASTVLPAFDAQLNGEIGLALPNFNYMQGSVYLDILTGANLVQMFAPGADRTMDEPEFVYDFNMMEGEQAALIFYGPADGDYGPEDFLKITDDQNPEADLVKIRYTNLVLTSGQAPLGPVNVELRTAEGAQVARFEDVGYAETTDYILVPPNWYTFHVTRVGDGAPFADFNGSENAGLPLRGGDIRHLIHYGPFGGQQFIRFNPSTFAERIYSP